MSRCRVVVPEMVRVPLSDGDYLDVKQELNAGEYVALLTAMAERRPFAKVLAYVIGWSLIGVDGKPMPYDIETPEQTRRSTVSALDKDTLREMIAALDKHEQAGDEAREEKKKAFRTATVSSARLTSVA
jgi:hypothetical protein